MKYKGHILMRMSLPIFWCFDNKARGIIASMMSSPPPKPEWVEWPLNDELQPVHEFANYEELFKEMSKPPKHVRVA